MKLSLENHGSLWLARPLDDETAEHLRDNVSDEAQWFGNALVIEPRYVQDFADMFTGNGGEIA
jgi:hypothetical protein